MNFAESYESNINILAYRILWIIFFSGFAFFALFIISGVISRTWLEYGINVTTVLLCLLSQLSAKDFIQTAIRLNIFWS